VVACASGALACGSSAATGPVDAAIDAGAGETGASEAGPTCQPATLDEWMPAAYHHAQPAQAAACTSALVADFYASCLGPTASGSACDQNWGCGDDGGCIEDVAHATCQRCLVTPSTNPTWGPIVDYGATVSVNVAGCIELLDPANTACATSVQQADECEHEACDTACPALADFDSCVAVADEGPCATYAQGSACQAMEADGGPASACVAGATFGELFAAAAKVFCGGG
jgi:hypothetical protein